MQAVQYNQPGVILCVGLLFALLAASSGHPMAARMGSLCNNTWRYPTDCRMPNCTYQIAWHYWEAEEEIEFTISSSIPDCWTGVFLSNEPMGPPSMGVLVWERDNNYTAKVFHIYSSSRTDRVLNATKISSRFLNGMVTNTFTLKRDILSRFDFECPYLVFPVYGGFVDLESQQIDLSGVGYFAPLHRVCIPWKHHCEPGPSHYLNMGNRNFFHNIPDTEPILAGPDQAHQFG